MGNTKTDKVFIFAGRATENLARRVADIYGIPLGNSTVFQYADGEFQPSYEETIRGGVVFIIQSTLPPTDNLFELLMMVDAARRASAEKIIAVIPYYGFARQDRKDKPHVPIASKLIANMLTVAGIDRVICMDLHADQIQGFFNIPVDHLYGSSLFMPYIREKFDIDEVMFASPDMGGSKRAGMYAKTLNNSFVICYKHRNKPNEIGEMRLIGDVKDKHVILLDDIIDTGSTICKAASIIMDNGAKSVRMMAVHPVLSDPCYDLLKNDNPFDAIIVSDSIPLPERFKELGVFRVVSLSTVIAETIDRIVNNVPLSGVYSAIGHKDSANS